MKVKNEIHRRLQGRLAARKKQNRFRALRSDLVSIDPKFDFCSNDYFGLGRKQCRLTGFAGSTGSRLISGNFAAAEKLETIVAEAAGTESALLFSNGYTANLGLLSSLCEKEALVLFDADIHASMKDGLRLSHARKMRFKHNDLSHLESLLRKNSEVSEKFVLTESVFSMDGSHCPDDILALCEKYDAELIVDEAHATGTFGSSGGGVFSAPDLASRVFARVLTFGKAIGGFGACVVGSQTLKDYLVNFGRSFIYTTALPPAYVDFMCARWELVTKSAPSFQKTLNRNIDFFRRELAERTGSLPPSNTMIQPVIVPGEENVKKLTRELTADGFGVYPIVSPTVPIGVERLRITLHTTNDEDAIKRLVDRISPYVKEQEK